GTSTRIMPIWPPPSSWQGRVRFVCPSCGMGRPSPSPSAKTRSKSGLPRGPKSAGSGVANAFIS
ncbi:hypothetical protein HWV62_1474, partial [Athelia sp. TMB]